MNDIVFFQTAPRSGTQWFAKYLGEIYGDLAIVTHEPIGYAYRAQEYLRNYVPQALATECAETEIRTHIDYIRAVARDRKYIEIGFPSYAALPALEREFRGQLKIVHVARHPVFNAASLVTHGFYRSRPDLDRDVLPTPDDRVAQDFYADQWESLSQFEKCLFFWSELHLHSLELRERYPEIPFLFLRFEDVFENDHASEVLEELTRFLGLPWRAELAAKIRKNVDSHVHSVPRIIGWQKIYEHPQTLALAQRFGYELATVDSIRISSRYQVHSSAFGNVLHRAWRRVNRVIKQG